MTRFALLLAAASALALPIAAEARPMTATDLQSMRRMGAPEVSPDGRTAIFSLSTTDFDENKRDEQIYQLDLTRPGSTPQPISGTEGAREAVFGPDGAVYFLKKVGERAQLHRMAMGQAAIAISDFGANPNGFEISPDGRHVVVWADTRDCPDMACAATTFPAPEPGSGKIHESLAVRSWDRWTEPGTRSRLFSFPLEGGRLTGMGVRLTGELEGDTPSKPFGDEAEVAISRDGRTVYFAMREAGRIEPLNPNTDIFAAPIDGSAPPTNLTAANRAVDTRPAVSPDGRTLAYLAQSVPGHASDRNVIMLRDLASGTTRRLTGEWDRSVESLTWTPDSRALLVDAQDTLQTPLWRVDVRSGRVTRLTREGTAGNPRPLANGDILFTMNSVMQPDDLYRMDRRGRVRQLTAVNSERLRELDPVSFETWSFAGANGATVHGYTFKPANVSRSLPVAFIVHGGPHGTFNNSWSYRWNPRAMSNGRYAVVSVDFHGSSGFGQAFLDSIHGDWGGKPLEDLQKGWAFALGRDPQLDRNRACALGGSYGGYMINWIAGRWSDGFRCLVNHNGVFDNRSMAYETDIPGFMDRQMGAVPHEDPAAYERHNPVNHVANWKTPMLVVIGDRDYRVPMSQGLMTFTALQRLGVPSRLLRFPDENHWVLKPVNSVQWYREVHRWMDQWTGPPPIMGEGK